MHPELQSLVARDVALAWRTCLGGWKPSSNLTMPDYPAWRFWLNSTWPTLHDAVGRVHAAANEADLSAIVEIDRSLNAFFPSSTAGHSAFSGRMFCERFSRIDGDKVWRAWLREADTGNSPAHLAICLAIRAARFHFPPSTAALLLLAVESFGAGLLFYSPQFQTLAAEALPELRASSLKAA